VHRLMRVLCDFNLAVLRRFAAYPIDGVYFGDDWGSQRAMLMAPATWRRLVKPYLQEMYGQAHRQGWDVFIHCCGQVTPILDDLVEIGLNVFNPFQPEVMDIESLMKRYSRRLAFYGSLSIQRTLPFGTEDDVRREVRHRLSLARAHGGLILSPSHDMPPDVPVKNVLAMLGALRDQ
ncbi:MAG TPA: uroporphyrinogen decarboxylase family protein, partial [Spirochaetia bacterium]|nr:uroporphyrinogen decarboxylase family protein [Spirochaetia bacterium]